MSALIAIVTLQGCTSKPNYESAHLAGTVKIEGESVQEGKLAFLPVGEAHGPVVGAAIVAGRYDCPRVPLGDSLVQVYALRPTGKRIMVMGTEVPEMQNLVPLQDRAGIAIRVTRDKLDQDFILVSKAQPPS